MVRQTTAYSSTPLCLDLPAPDCCPHESRAIRHCEGQQQRRDVPFDGLFGYAALLRNCLVREPLGHEHQNLALALRERRLCPRDPLAQVT